LRSDCNKNDAYPNCRYTGEVHAPVGFGRWMEHRTFVHRRGAGKIVLIPCVRDGVIREVRCTEFSPRSGGLVLLSKFRDAGCKYFVGKTLEHFYEKARRNAFYNPAPVFTINMTAPVNSDAVRFQAELIRSMAQAFRAPAAFIDPRLSKYSSARIAEQAKRDAVLRDAIPARIERELSLFDDKWKQSSRAADTLLDCAVRTCRAVRRRFGDVLAELRAARRELDAIKEENFNLRAANAKLPSRVKEHHHEEPVQHRRCDSRHVPVHPGRLRCDRGGEAGALVSKKPVPKPGTRCAQCGRALDRYVFQDAFPPKQYVFTLRKDADDIERRLHPECVKAFDADNPNPPAKVRPKT